MKRNYKSTLDNLFLNFILVIQIPFWGGLGLRLLRERSVLLQVKFKVVVIGDPGLLGCPRSRGVGMGGGLVGAGVSPEPRCPLPAPTGAQAPFCKDRLGDTLTIQAADKRCLLVGLSSDLEAHTPAISLGSPLTRAVSALFCPSPHSGPQDALGGGCHPGPGCQSWTVRALGCWPRPERGLGLALSWVHFRGTLEVQVCLFGQRGGSCDASSVVHAACRSALSVHAPVWLMPPCRGGS